MYFNSDRGACAVRDAHRFALAIASQRAGRTPSRVPHARTATLALAACHQRWHDDRRLPPSTTSRLGALRERQQRPAKDATSSIEQRRRFSEEGSKSESMVLVGERRTIGRARRSRGSTPSAGQVGLVRAMPEGGTISAAAADRHQGGFKISSLNQTALPPERGSQPHDDASASTMAKPLPCGLVRLTCKGCRSEIGPTSVTSTWMLSSRRSSVSIGLPEACTIALATSSDARSCAVATTDGVIPSKAECTMRRA